MLSRFLVGACALLLLLGAATAQERAPGAAIGGETEAFSRKAAALMESHADGGVFSGAVIVARDGIPLFRHAYGMADREWAIPNTPDTVFRIGSITKQFTAAAILKLAGAGSLSLDDPAIRYLPELPPAWAPMTIRMLLNHSSGLPNVTALPGYATQLGRIERSPMETVALLYREDLLFPPGSGHEYSNTGYILLAGLIERITGQSFARYLNDAILAPAGLASTRTPIPAPSSPGAPTVTAASLANGATPCPWPPAPRRVPACWPRPSTISSPGTGRCSPAVCCRRRRAGPW